MVFITQFYAHSTFCQIKSPQISQLVETELHKSFSFHQIKDNIGILKFLQFLILIGLVSRFISLFREVVRQSHRSDLDGA